MPCSRELPYRSQGDLEGFYASIQAPAPAGSGGRIRESTGHGSGEATGMFELPDGTSGSYRGTPGKTIVVSTDGCSAASSTHQPSANNAPKIFAVAFALAAISVGVAAALIGGRR